MGKSEVIDVFKECLSAYNNLLKSRQELNVSADNFLESYTPNTLLSGICYCVFSDCKLSMLYRVSDTLGKYTNINSFYTTPLYECKTKGEQEQSIKKRIELLETIIKKEEYEATKS